MRVNGLFTSESVSDGHPDKVADKISDAILDKFIAEDPKSRVAIECAVTRGQVIVMGEVKSEAYVNIDHTVRMAIKKIGYSCPKIGFDYNNCGVLSAVREQSPDINQGVDRKTEESQGAGDQGIMFGYATNETREFMPMTLQLAHDILLNLKSKRDSNDWLYPDAKSQVTMLYKDGVPVKLETIVVSTHHKALDSDPNKTLEMIRQSLNILIRDHLVKWSEGYPNIDFNNPLLHINPTGSFLIGGPAADSGVTGRKIIVDTYGGRGHHGGGAFSGKDPSKVDRSASYMARYIAKNIVAAKLASSCNVQLAYAIGVAKPVGVYIDAEDLPEGITNEKITDAITGFIDLTPYGIIKKLDLLNPIYSITSSYGHFGRVPFKLASSDTANYFSWELLDLAPELRKHFKLDN